MISYNDFKRLCIDAQDCSTLENYMAEVGGSVDAGGAEQTARLLTAIWEMVQGGMQFRVIASACGMSMRKLGVVLGISYKTIEKWSAGDRKASGWTLMLVAYAAISMLADEI